MAVVTFSLQQVSSTSAPGIGFFARVQYVSNNLYLDTSTNSLVPLSDAVTPNIVMTESPGGSGNWTWNYDFGLIPDGAYVCYSYESTQNLTAGQPQYINTVNGDLVQNIASTTVGLSANTGGINALQYTTSAGAPIVGATIRVYTQADFSALRLSTPIGVTTTDPNGLWTSPIFVQTGNTYVVQFTLPNNYGPDTATVTV